MLGDDLGVERQVLVDHPAEAEPLLGRTPAGEAGQGADVGDPADHLVVVGRQVARDAVVDEQSPPGAGFLADVCRAWERQIFGIQKMGVRTVGVRVGIVLGRDGGALASMLLPFRLGAGGRLGSGEQWMSWIHVDDVVALFVHVLGNEAARGPVRRSSWVPTGTRGRASHSSASSARAAAAPKTVPGPMPRPE